LVTAADGLPFLLNEERFKSTDLKVYVNADQSALQPSKCWRGRSRRLQAGNGGPEATTVLSSARETVAQERGSSHALRFRRRSGRETRHCACGTTVSSPT
jgi:hypothetical protein